MGIPSFGASASDILKGPRMGHVTIFTAITIIYHKDSIKIKNMFVLAWLWQYYVFQK